MNLSVLLNPQTSTQKRLFKSFLILEVFLLIGLLFTTFRINFRFGSSHRLEFNLIDATANKSISVSKRQAEFWPFVKFYEKDSVIDITTWRSYLPLRYFNGLFYQFDFSEFLIYTLAGAIAYAYLIRKSITKEPN